MNSSVDFISLAIGVGLVVLLVRAGAKSRAKAVRVGLLALSKQGGAGHTD
jgi:hypothetical protein